MIWRWPTELNPVGYVVSYCNQNKSFSFLGNLIHDSPQNSWFNQRITKFCNRILNGLKCATILMRQQPLHVFSHEDLRLYFLHCSRQFEEKCSASIVESCSFASIRESLTREAPRKEIHFASQRGEINMSHITLNDIPVWPVGPESIACRFVKLIEQHMIESSKRHAESQAACASKQLHRVILSERHNILLFLPTAFLHG